MNQVTRPQDNETNSVVLVGIDFLALSKEVLLHAAELAVSAGGELHVVHVMPDGAVNGDRAGAVVSLAEDGQAKLEHLAADLPASLTRIFLHLMHGKVDVEIAQLASDIGADLVVLGTRGRSGVDRFIDGSVAESLLRLAPCPVLVYRPKSIPAWEQIAPPCPDCLEVKRTTQRGRLWCDRHSERHVPRHTYADAPASYAMGSLGFR